MTDKRNPWAGLSSYQDGDWRIFCGRESDNYDVAKLVDNNIFVTLYGKSGIGKSSLLNAGVFPRLRAEGYLPVSVRLGIEAGNYSLQTVIRSKIEEIIGMTGQTATTDIVPMPDNESDEIWLWSYFARNQFKDKNGSILFPVLVFDQFEEIFRTRPDDAAVLLRQIYFMMDESHALASKENYHYDFNFRFLASIREDELYRLEDCIDENYLPEMKKCRYRLRGLTELGAREVVLIPGAEYLESTEKEAIAEEIISIARNKVDGSISTNILSLVCSRAFDEMIRQGKEKIDLALVSGMISDNLFEKYYQEATSELSKRARAYIEDNLIDSADRRNSVSESDFFKAVPEGEILLKDGPKKILQRVAVTSGSNNTRIELVHDSFCEPLSQLRKQRKQSRRSSIIAISGVIAILASLSSIYLGRQLTWEKLENQTRIASEVALHLIEEDDFITARRIAAAILPKDLKHPKDRPYIPRAEYVLWKAWSSTNTVLKGHTGSVNSISLSPDGKMIASASDDGTVRIWDFATGQTINTLECNSFNVAVFSPDGQRIATGYQKDSICLWNTDTWERTMVLGGSDSNVQSVDFSRDGKIIASGFMDGSIYIWDVLTGIRLHTIKGHTKGVESVSFSPDGKRIVSGGRDGYAYIWNVSNGNLITQLDEPYETISSVRFSPNGDLIATASWDNYIRIYDSRTGELMTDPMEEPNGSAQFVSFSPDGAKILSGSAYYIHEWDYLEGRRLSNYSGHYNGVNSALYSPDGRWIVSCADDNTLRIWDTLKEDASNNILYKHADWTHSVSVSPDGKIASGGSDKKVIIWDTESGRQIAERTMPERIYEVAFSPNGNHLASRLRDGSVQVWDLENNHVIPLMYYNAYSVAYSRDEKSIVTGGYGVIRFWDLTTGEMTKTIEVNHDVIISTICFSPDGDWLASGAYDGIVRIWKVASGELITPSERHTSHISEVCFSPNARIIASAGYSDHKVNIWDIHSKKIIKTLVLTENIESIAISPDNRQIAVACSNRKIHIFDIATGELVQTIEGNHGNIVYGPNDMGIVLGSPDGTVRLLNVSTEKLLKETRNLYPALTQEEKKRYYIK